MLSICRLQLSDGRVVIQKHIQKANSRRNQQMVRLLGHSDVSTMASHQCEYGLYSLPPNGQRKRSPKQINWANNCTPTLEKQHRLSKGNHGQQWLNGGRTKAAKNFPPELVIETLRCIRDTTDRMEQINADQQPKAETTGNVCNKDVRELLVRH